jgi:CubicO group peptidase (beta-lactamase class C family)
MPASRRRADTYLPRMRQVETCLCPPVLIAGQSAVQWTLEDRMAHYRIPGVSIALIHDTHVQWAKGYGLLEMGSGQHVLEETLFQAASISKMVTALAVLTLVDDGQLGLDQPVNTVLRSWKLPESRYTREREVTVGHLLSHTAGLTVPAFRGYSRNEPLPTLTQCLDAQPPACGEPVRVCRPPGEAFRYSGGGYGILEQILVDCTGQSFPELMERRVFRPLGLARSTFRQPSLSNGCQSVARGHRADGTGIPGGWELDPVLASAGLWSTPSDLAHLGLDLAHAYAGRPASSLSPTLARTMLGPHAETGWENLGRWMGLGVFLSDKGETGTFSHSGSNAGYRSLLIAAKRGGWGAVIMANGDAGDLLISEIVQSMARVYQWPGIEPQVRARSEIDSKILHSYLGEYRLASGQRVRMTLEGGELVMHAPRSVPLPLYPESETRFFSTAMVSPIQFFHDARQRVTRMKWGHQRAQRIG